jgi:FkbM family methyltransferase
MQSAFTQRFLTQTYTVDTPAGELSFVLLGRTAAGRARTILTKQPATIAWIDGFREGSVFWDIGANVGVYSLYAARRGHARVVAFEPAAINYFLLAANCEANGLEERIDSLLLGVGQELGLARLEVSQFASAKSFSFRRHPERNRASRQPSLILSIDHLVEEFGLPSPTYIKIDTPGMSEAIIAGGERTLQRSDVREIHIELRESKAGQRITAQLERHGFRLTARDVHGGSADATFVRSGPGSM